ncbi:MAG TPA: mechanosensitive ion channel domain-containing protein [Myxococcaceae bacterium]|nr:mechanosensitive ion channel domain-containing protein [Myxococcaceae bacterium]
MKSCTPVLLVGLLLAGAAPGAGAEEPSASQPPAVVRLRDRPVLELRAPLGGRSPRIRAQDAGEALVHALEQPGPDTVRLEPREEAVALRVGTLLLLELGPEDARAAGTADLSLYAAATAQKIETALKAERRRVQIQDSVFSVSLAVFISLLAFLALQLVGRLGTQLQETLLSDRERVPALRLGSVEVASRRAVRGALHLGLRLGTRVVQVVVVYVWLLFLLSLFAATREYGSRLTGSVLRPSGALLARLGAALPMLVVAALLALVVALVVRTLRLFFDSIARGETHVRWISADLARPVGVLLRGALVVLAILFAAPLVTGGDSGALSWLAMAVLATLALGAVPLLASFAVGLPTVLGRTLKSGEMVELGGRQGQVREVTMLEVRLEDGEGAELRIPHLVAFLHPTRSLGAVERRMFEVVVASSEDQARVESVLLEAAGSHASGARVELLTLDARGARWRVSGIHPDLGQRVATALRDARIALGQPAGEDAG